MWNGVDVVVATINEAIVEVVTLLSLFWISNSNIMQFYLLFLWQLANILWVKNSTHYHPPCIKIMMLFMCLYYDFI